MTIPISHLLAVSIESFLLSAFCSDFRGHFSVDFKSLWGGGGGNGVPETLHVCLGWSYRGVFLCKEIIEYTLKIYILKTTTFLSRMLIFN